jgi:multiple sugar transport system substrate-binding protein
MGRRLEARSSATGRESPLSTQGISLTGITWNHSRGFTPIVATAQRYMDAHPDVTIEWQRRSLKDFGDFPIQRLADHFDLLIIDHPFAGYAAANPVLVPLDSELDDAFLADQTVNSVGRSYESYRYGEHLWALPVDAATPISGWRADLLARYELSLPETWDDLLQLARQRRVAVPGTAVDTIMAFYMLAVALGEEPCQRDDEVVSEAVAIEAIERFRELILVAGPENLDRNPIRTWEALTSRDDLVYCPFAYGYSNYGRHDFTGKPLQFGGLVTLNGVPLRSTLGGTGLAISRRCQHLEVALDYVRYVASPSCQRGLYTLSGGQPGHRQAWLDPELNQLTNNFFESTLPTLDHAYLRPRYAGYIPFQEAAGDLIHDFVRLGGSAKETVGTINKHYRESLTNA